MLQAFVSNSSKACKAYNGLPDKSTNQDSVSQANTARSIKILYTGGLISKAIRNADIEFSRKCKQNKCTTIPCVLKYKGLMQFMNSLDMGQVIQIDAVKGCRRDVEELLEKLAFLYLVIDEHFHHAFLSWFHNPHGTFCVSLSGDGAPF